MMTAMMALSNDPAAAAASPVLPHPGHTAGCVGHDHHDPESAPAGRPRCKHAHGDDGRDNERRTLVAFAVTVIFMAVEAGGGWLSGSLALLADAAHMLADALALLMSWAAFRFGRMAADSKRSYGYRRLEVLAALVNGLTILAITVGIVWEAAQRLAHPEAVRGVPMLAVAVVGLIANLVTLKVLGHQHNHAHAEADDGDHDHAENLNLRGASLHVLGDLLGSVAAVVAAGVIMATGWTPVDPILSVAMALMIVINATQLVRSSTHILMEGTPEGFDPEGLRRELLTDVPDLVEVHHIHAWSVTSGRPMLTLHAVTRQDSDRDAVLHAIKRVLADEFGFSHSVVQIEGDGCGESRCG